MRNSRLHCVLRRLSAIFCVGIVCSYASVGQAEEAARYIITFRDTSKATSRAIWANRYNRLKQASTRIGKAAVGASQDLESKLGSVGVQSIDQIAADNSLVVRLTPHEAASLASSPEVADIEVDSPVWALRETNDPLLNQQVSLRDSTGISATSAWDLTSGSRSAMVAIIDTGADLNHPDLKDNIWRNQKEKPNNGRDDDKNGYIDDVFGYDFINKDSSPQDDNGHGTHVAGIIGAAGDNSVGVAGVAWSSKIVVVKVLDGEGNGYISAVIKAIDYITELKKRGVPIAVMNLSLGGTNDSRALYRAVERARNHDIILVAAAGNEGANNDASPIYPANFDLDSVVSVAATTVDGKLASFSNYGAATVHLAAPGSSIISTAPRGLGIEYRSLSGTSMASPHVAGVLALAAAANPALTMLQVREVVVSSVRPLAALTNVTRTGGLVDASASVYQAQARQALPRIFGYIRRSDKGVGGVTVSLLSSDGALVVQATTSAKDGSYSFSNVALGSYRLTVKGRGVRLKPLVIRATSARLIRKNVVG